MTNEALLERIRKRYDYMKTAWRVVREEKREDMRYLSGDGWDPKERRAREGAKRPIISMDELNQYVNQIVNDVRINKRSGNMLPEGDGANDKTAELRESKIRQIESESKAQGAYCYAYEGAVSGGYGAIIIRKRFSKTGTWDQEVRIERVPNADSILIDPDFKEADASDIQDAFIIDRMSREQFAREFPGAKVVSFTPEISSITGADWIGDDFIQVAEYWYVEKSYREIFRLDNGSDTGFTVYRDECDVVHKGEAQIGPYTYKILNRRKEEKVRVCQCRTNGVEILDESGWDGHYIPIIMCLGKEQWVDDGSGAKRRLVSAVRLARDPQQVYNYYRTCEAELIGSAPKTPYRGYVGQFHKPEMWQSVNRVPRAYLEANAYTDQYPYEAGKPPLPLPQRENFEPAIQALEIGAESARRAIMSAMGISPLPTSAQRQNEKSGVALERIQSQQAQGAYHFIDSYDRFLAHAWRVMDDLLPTVYDAARTTALQKRDGTVQVVPINQPIYKPDAAPDAKPEVLDMTAGNHGVTISTGPSYQSEREEATDFAAQIASPDMLVAALSGNPKAAKIVALAIKLRNGGPIMDQIADVIDPENPEGPGGQPMDPAALMQQVQQLQQAVMQLQQLANKEAAATERVQIQVDSKERIAQEEIRSKERIATARNRTDIATTAMGERGEDQRTLFRAKAEASAEDRDREAVDRLRGEEE